MISPFSPMKWRIVTVGKPRLEYARQGVDEYLARMRRGDAIEIQQVKAGPSPEVEGQVLIARSADCFRIVMDERGRQFSSLEFAEYVRDLRDGGVRQAAVLLGGADGHSPEARRSADLLWSLGKLTLQHELALVVVVEQIYRAQMILAGTPYHRE